MKILKNHSRDLYIYGHIPLWDMPAGNYGSCIQQVSPVQADEYNYHDLKDLPQNPKKDLSQRTGPCNNLYSQAQILKYKIL